MPAYSHTYSELFQKLDWLLKQEKEGADTAAADKFRILPSTQAKTVVTETINALVDKAPGRYEREVIVRLVTPPEYKQPEYGYYDISTESEFVKDKILILPPRFCAVHSVLMPSGRWERLFDSSQSNLAMYSPAHNEIYNSDGWLVDTELRMKAVMYPRPIKNNVTVSVASAAVIGDVYLKVVTTTEHGFSYGDTVTLSNFAPNDYNGTYDIIDVPSSTSFVVYLGDDYGEIDEVGEVILDSDDWLIEVDDSFFEYLQLEIKRRALGRMGKGMSQYEYSLMREYEQRWCDSHGRVLQKAAKYVRGYGFGK